MNDLILHPEYESLKREIEGLRNDIVAIRTRIDHIKTVDEVFCQKEYSKYFGELEQQILQKYYQCCLFKRKLEMIQAALNRGAKPNMPSIMRILDAEAEAYNADLKARAEKLKELSKVKFTTPSPDDELQAKKLYQKIVKALHPDINPSATKDDFETLQDAIEAFANGDIATLDAIAAILEKEGKLNSAPISGSMEDLKDQQIHLTKTAESLALQLKKIKESFPMNQEALLNDKKLISEKIRALKIQNQEQQEILDSYIERLKPFDGNPKAEKN